MSQYRQDSHYSLNGLPRYLTTDWDTAWVSVKILDDLEPTIAITGHGLPMSGVELKQNFKKLVKERVQNNHVLPDTAKNESSKGRHCIKST